MRCIYLDNGVPFMVNSCLFLELTLEGRCKDYFHIYSMRDKLCTFKATNNQGPKVIIFELDEVFRRHRYINKDVNRNPNGFDTFEKNCKDFCSM